MNHLDICEHCGGLLVREQPHCLVCGYNHISHTMETADPNVAAYQLHPWVTIVDTFAARIGRVHFGAHRRTCVGSDQRRA